MKYFGLLIVLLFFRINLFCQVLVPANYYPFKAYLHAIFNEEKPIEIPLTNLDTSGNTDISLTLINTIQKVTDSLRKQQAKRKISFVFPAGKFLLLNPIFIPSYTEIKGQGGNLTTILIKTGEGNAGFYLKPTNTNPILTLPILTGINAGSFSIPLTSIQAVYVDSVLNLDTTISYLGAIKIQNDEDLITSSWAKGTVKELFIVGKIETINNQFYLKCQSQQAKQHESKTAFTLNYPLSKAPMLEIFKPQIESSISCLKVIRVDTTMSQTSNIVIENSIYCEIKAVESYKCNFAHLSINQSFGCLVKRCNFSYANNYGGGGKGYGLVLQSSASTNNIGDNLFNHLRHSILLQSGANNNIILANCSINPFWQEGFFPSDAAGDLVLHGNYPFANLFELNMAQQVVIDNSHGKNGPKNIFNRNFLQGYGIALLVANGSDSQVFTGNEILNSFKGLYTLNDKGHFTYANSVKGTITPNGTTNYSSILYSKANYVNKYKKRDLKTHYPSFIDYTNPVFGPPFNQTNKTIPAFDFKNQSPVCNIKQEDSIVNLPLNLKAIREKKLQIIPNPSNGFITLNLSGIIELYSLNGSKLYSNNYQANTKLHLKTKGTYILVLKTTSKTFTSKIINND